MNLTRATRNLSAAVVAGIAAWSSYQHMVHVALTVGERPDVAYVVPLSVDGMLVVASVAMVDDRRAGRSVRWSAKVAFAVGVLASVAANVAAAHPTIGARVVAAWPALALLLTVELLSRAGKVLKTAAAVAELADERPPALAEVEQPAGPRPPRKALPSSADRVARAAARTPNATSAQLAARLDLSEATVQRHLRKLRGHADTVSTPKLTAPASPAPAGA